ncbi:NUDIX domain-containing protein [Patescibacteria group bacterium]|nr:NUDIX domain-containing protein [Patescibacteria group bacterium]MBU1703300.1 NUDIX domain-containing protein [Patescibacteria group bacterium]MBU1953547.1 NUDIX domain-containing protein [Patescibacteria group bacterium]
MKADKQFLIASVYILLEENGKILMLRRCNTGFADGQYSLVAGHVEKGESFKEAAIRESHEEIGINIQKEDLEFFHVMYRETESEERLDVFFAAKRWNGEIINMEPSKCDDLIWVDLNQLPANCLDYVEYALQCKLNNTCMSEWSRDIL